MIMYINDFSFKRAVPVWKNGDTEVMNQTVELSCFMYKQDATLNISASTFYELFVNGELRSHGPARCAHGYFRVDEIDIGKWLRDGKNEIRIKVCGYNVNSYAWLDQPSFVCAEIVNNDEIIAYTCDKFCGFAAFVNGERIQKVQRYSFQRAFAEVYRLGKGEVRTPIELEVCKAGRFIRREIPYGEYGVHLPEAVIERGRVCFEEMTEYKSNRFISGNGFVIDGVLRKGYKPDELEYASCIEYEKAVFSDRTEAYEDADDIILSDGCYADVRFEANRAGIIALDVEACGDGTLFVAYDERYLENGPEPLTHGRTCVLTCDAAKGSYTVFTAEPYVFKYIRLVSKGADFKVKRLRQYAVEYPPSHIKARLVTDDEQMRLIYKAAVNTFCDNTVDIYMDCPSRERAGWLCDSFFTARVERILTGRSDVEKAFLYNFLYHPEDKHLPKGMLPMCYPSDHFNGNFIPNWAMWYVIELKEYAERSGDRQIISDAQCAMYALLEYFRGFENSDGLLEKLDGWVFVDWSEANNLVQDVSYASNMMYAYCLDTVGEMYGDGALTEKSEAIRRVIREQSMTESGFFCDNAVRNEEGELSLSGKCTEACQYYAFFTGVATPELYPELWIRLVREFGFDRMKKGLYPEIYPANAFIANYIRLEILCRNGENEALYKDIKEYFTYMAEKTGTLWEKTDDRSSLNHGFASHVIYWMDRLGLIK